MGKKRLIEVVSVYTEDKLDSNGALRNVAVKDAWQRLRQNIQVNSWKKAEKVLQELTENLQKINMLKSMTSTLNKLKTAFQNPDQLVEEGDYLQQTPRDTPRESPSRPPPTNPGDTIKQSDEVKQLYGCLDDVRQSLETNGQVPDKVLVPNDVTSGARAGYQALAAICDKCRKSIRELEHVRTRLENSETRNKELEKLVDDKENKIDQLTTAVETLEQKHSVIKQDKMDGMKDMLKVNSLERQVNNSKVEINKLKEENQQLKERLDRLLEQKGSETADLYNMFPPDTINAMFKQLYNTERKDVIDYYTTSLQASAQESAKKTLSLLKDAYTYCTEESERQMNLLTDALVNPSHQLSQHQGADSLQEIDVVQIGHLRRQTCKYSREHVKNSFVTHLESGGEQRYTLGELTACMPYLERCVEVCWLMCLQSPAMYLPLHEMPASQTTLDKTKYEVTSGKGNKIDFVLWPPLYRSQDGELLCKGFVQVQ